MKRVLLIVLQWLALTVLSSGLDVDRQKHYEEWIAAGDSWENRWEGTLAKVDSKPLPERFEILGRAVRLGERSILQSPNEKQQKFSSQATKKLITIPGHAEYFGNKAWEIYRKYQEGFEDGKGAFYFPVYAEETDEAFKTLALLPSVETVGVLGKMLDEQWKRPGFDALEERGLMQSTFGIGALSALSKLPIANPPSGPLPHLGVLRENLGAWQQWYREVESGRRTFRFVGDDTEYDLRGPVRRGEVNDRSRGAKKSVGVNDSTDREPREIETPANRLPLYVALGMILAGLGWWGIRRIGWNS